jgi:FAD synthase
MKLVADFKPETPVIANVGVWDPFMSDHTRMFEELRATAEERGHTPCALLLEPHPARFIAGPAGRPVFDDAITRIEHIRDCGVRVATIEFEEEDLKAGIVELLDLVGEWCTLSSLWLGASQSLGSGPKGSTLAIAVETQQRNIELHRMPMPKQQARGSYAKTFLSRGRVRDAAGAVGRLPVRNRTSESEVETCWLQGDYEALFVREGILEQERRMIVMKARGAGAVTFAWPGAEVERVVFVNGPGDGPATPQTAERAVIV